MKIKYLPKIVFLFFPDPLPVEADLAPLPRPLLPGRGGSGRVRRVRTRGRRGRRGPHPDEGLRQPEVLGDVRHTGRGL